MKTKHELEINFETRLLLKNLLKDLLAEDHPETNKALIEIINALILSGGKYLSVEKATEELQKLHHGGHQENRYVAYALALLLSYERIYRHIEDLETSSGNSPDTELEIYFRYHPETKISKENRVKQIFELYKISAKGGHLPAYRGLFFLDNHLKRATECANRVQKELSADPKQHEREHRKRNFIKYLYAYCEEYGISSDAISKKECEEFRALGADTDYAAPDPIRLFSPMDGQLVNKIKQGKNQSIAFVDYFIGFCTEHRILGNLEYLRA